MSSQFIHPSAADYRDYLGKTIFSRDKSKRGRVVSVHMRQCAACGYAPCCRVVWEDGKITKPCVNGITLLPDGSLKID